ncbi:MAG TPA: hypothetical protein VLL76_07435 [Candidatus Omnitrophota bacterium]|nr:hypothetical protein [Candidatus Omnitrophota bacterium]
MWRWLSLGAIVGLGACSSAESIQLADHETCLDMGFEAWSLDYSYCRLTLEQGRTGAARLVLLPPKGPRGTAAREQTLPRGLTKTPPEPTSVPAPALAPPPALAPAPAQPPEPEQSEEPPPPAAAPRPQVRAGAI